MDSWLTQDERRRLSLEWFDDSATLGWGNVSRTQLSIARDSGGVTLKGHRYIYFPFTDELWREDVVKLVKKWRKDAKAAEAPGHRTAEQFGLDLWAGLL